LRKYNINKHRMKRKFNKFIDNRGGYFTLFAVIIVCLIMFMVSKYIINTNTVDMADTDIATKTNINITTTNSIDIITTSSINVTPTSIILPTITPTLSPDEHLMSRGNIGMEGRKKLITEPPTIKKEIKKEIKIVETAKPVKPKVDFTYVDYFVGNITMYTLHPSECGGKLPSHPAFGIGASGLKVKTNHSVALGKQIPFGTTIKIEGFNTIFTKDDTGSAIGWNCVDIFVDNRDEAFKFGRQQRKVWILKWGKG